MRIAISGYGGTGKTSLALILKEKLEALGVRVEVITYTLRDLAREKGMTLEEIQKEAEKNPKIDLELDAKIKEKFESAENAISATWISIWNLKDVADLRIFLFAPEKERVRRVAERDGIPFEEALEKERRRLEENRSRYLRLYGFDILKPEEVSDLCINTARFSLEEEAEIILSALKGKGML